MRNTLIINFFGAPGSGKSTLSSGLYHLLKKRGEYTCELVTEFAKDLAWEDRKQCLNDQLYISAKQNHRLQRLNEQVEVIVSDSPLLQGLVYAKKDYFPAYFDLVKQVFNSYRNTNFLVKRTKKYCTKGRLQTENESDALHPIIESLLKENGMPYIEISSDIDMNDLCSLIKDFPNRTETRE